MKKIVIKFGTIIAIFLLNIPKLHWIIWPLAKHFVAGRTLEEILATATSLAKKGYPLILNYASECATNLKQVKKIHQANMRILDWIHTNKTRCWIAIKLSMYNLETPNPKNETDKRGLLTDFMQKAKQYKIRVRIDAEHLKNRDHYNQIVNRIWQGGYHNIWRVIQANGPSADWKEFVKACAKTPIPCSICKGAYRNDKGALSFETQYPQILAQFKYAEQEMLSRGVEIEKATHDNSLIGSGNTSYITHHAMLYGINIKRAKELRAHIYLLGGPDWAKYMKRRIIENPEYLLLPFKTLFKKTSSEINAY